MPLQGHQVAAGVGGEEQARLPVDHAVGCEEGAREWVTLDTGMSPWGLFHSLLKGGPISALATQGEVWGGLRWNQAVFEED